MPIGTSDGEYFDNKFEAMVGSGVTAGLKRIPIVKDPEISPGQNPGDYGMVVDPFVMQQNKNLDQIETDPQYGIGLDVNFRRPLGSPTEPAGALKPPEGTRVAPPNNFDVSAGIDWSKMNQPFGDIKSTSKEDTPIVARTANGMITFHEGDINEAVNVGLGVGPGLMAGVKSKALPKDMLYKAQNMEMDGAHADDIWKETGFGRGADNRWKYEINDRAADLNSSAFEMTPASAKSMASKSANPKGWEGIEVEPWHQLITKDVNPKLKDVFNHPELYKAYPELADISVTKVPGMQMLAGVKGYYDPTIKQLAVSPGTLDQTRSIILHEIQHIIQGKEGFSTGANLPVFKTKQWKELSDAFEANKKEITDIVKEYFPNNPKILSDLKYALNNVEHLPHAEEFAAKGYKYAAENAKKIKDGLELMDQIPQLRESIERIIRGEKLIDQMQGELFKKYKSVKGEVEARSVQERRNMTEAQRRNLPPSISEDVPRSQQIWSPFDPAALTDLR